MNDNLQRKRSGASVDRLLADSGVENPGDIRTELLELRSLAAVTPPPSEAVLALMTASTGAQEPTTAALPVVAEAAPTAVLSTVVTAPDAAPGTEAEPATAKAAVNDELALRRRKRRAAFAGLAVAVSLAGGATAAAAQEGGIAGTFQHWGAAIGSVVEHFGPAETPANAPREEKPVQVPAPDGHTARTEPAPAPTADTVPGEAKPVTPPATGPGNPAGKEQSKEPARPTVPGNPLPLPAAPVGPEKVPTLEPPKIEPSDIPVPVPTHVLPEIPKAPANPAK